MTQTLGDVLVRCDDAKWSLALYLPPRRGWSLDTPCLLWDPDDASDGADAPEAASRLGFSYALGMGDVVDIVENARAQLATVTALQLLEAFLYYYDNDAFIRFDSRPSE